MNMHGNVIYNLETPRLDCKKKLSACAYLSVIVGVFVKFNELLYIVGKYVLTH